MRRLVARAIEPATVDGHVLKTVGGTAEWVEDPPPVIELDGLTDVDTSTVPPINGDLLTWDAAAGVWEPAAPPAVGLDDLTDVDTSAVAPVEGDTLTWDSVGGFWKPAAPARALVPWTTVTSVGEPVFMWDDNNNLMLIEES